MTGSVTFQQISGSYQLSLNNSLSRLRRTGGLLEERESGQTYALEKSLLQTEHAKGLSWVSARHRQPPEAKKGASGAVICLRDR